jgi:dipeptidyl aminopeptidase/acylaminoacyl peptidase
MQRATSFLQTLAALLVGGTLLGKPVEISDVMSFKTITDVAKVKGARKIVVALQTWNGGKTFQTDLFVVGMDGSVRRLTTSGVGSFAVSSDGTRIAFTGQRQGVNGIFVMSLDGGEPELLIETPIDVDNLRWVKERIYFTAFVLPECCSQLKCTADKLKAKEASGLIFDELYFRPWNFWRDGTRLALFYVDEKTKAINPAVCGNFDALPLPFGGKDDYDAREDGTIVYASKKGENLALSTNSDIYLLREGSDEVRLTENKGADRAPKFSPDGKVIGFLSQRTPSFESDLWQLKIMSVDTRESFTVGQNLDNWVVDFAFSSDGKKVFLGVEEKGYITVYMAEARPLAPLVPLLSRSVHRFLTPTEDGLVYTKESFISPRELFSIAFDKKGKIVERKITALNDDVLKSLDLPIVDEVWYPVSGEQEGRRKEVHAFIVRPKDTEEGKKYPLVVMIHGGPQGAWLNEMHPRWNPLGIVGHGFVVAMPNPTGSTGYGQDFVNKVSKDWGGACYNEIMAFLDYAQTLPYVDASRACAMGGSFGGYMTNWIEGQTDRFRCLVSHAGVSSLESKYGSTDELWFPEWDIGGTPWDNPSAYEKWSPHKYARNFKTPMLIIHGQNDFRVPLEQGLVMFTYLRRLGVEAKLLYYPDEGHFVTKPLNRKQWYDTVVEWLKSHLYR